METPVLKPRKCPKPLINTFAWAIWLKHLALRHIWLLYYKGSVLSIGFVSFFQLFSLLPRFLFSILIVVKKLHATFQSFSLKKCSMQ